jgi:hypothetical protein
MNLSPLQEELAKQIGESAIKLLIEVEATRSQSQKLWDLLAAKEALVRRYSADEALNEQFARLAAEAALKELRK